MHFHAALTETLRLYPAVPLVILSIWAHMYSRFGYVSKSWGEHRSKTGPDRGRNGPKCRTEDRTEMDGKYSEKDDILPDGFKIKKGDERRRYKLHGISNGKDDIHLGRRCRGIPSRKMAS
nr:hypothetical protein [Tanacetum cinerariifolium]